MRKYRYNFVRLNIDPNKVQSFKLSKPVNLVLFDFVLQFANKIWYQLPDGTIFPVSDEWDGHTFLKPSNIQTSDLHTMNFTYETD